MALLRPQIRTDASGQIAVAQRWRREFGQLGKWKKLGSESAIMAGK
jgi:hypothetical protein